MAFTPLARVRTNWILTAKFWGFGVQSERTVGGWWVSWGGNELISSQEGEIGKGRWGREIRRQRNGENGKSKWRKEREKALWWETGERSWETDNEREREHERLLGHMLYDLFIHWGMFSHMLSTHLYNKTGWVEEKFRTTVGKEMRKDEVRGKEMKDKGREIWQNQQFGGDRRVFSHVSNSGRLFFCTAVLLVTC